MSWGEEREGGGIEEGGEKGKKKGRKENRKKQIQVLCLISWS